MAPRLTPAGTLERRGGPVPPRIFMALALLCAGLAASPAAAQNAKLGRISYLADMPFGQLTNFSLDTVRAQNVCAFSGSGRYGILARGSGPGGAFSLTNGVTQLPYQVQWAPLPGRTSGTPMTSGVRLGGLTTPSIHPTCNIGIDRTASLILIIRAAALQNAARGNYSGTLTLILSPE